MTTTDFNNEKMSQTMIEIANEIVGNVGPSTVRSTAATGEPVIKYFVRFKREDDIYPHFKNWITAYCHMVDSHVYEGDFVVDPKKVRKKTIYWRKVPEITLRDNFFYINSRLLISNRNVFDLSERDFGQLTEVYIKHMKIIDNEPK